MKHRFTKKYKTFDIDKTNNKVERLEKNNPSLNINDKYEFLPDSISENLNMFYDSGFKLVTSEVWNKRIKTCRSCEYFIADSEKKIQKCDYCGCHMGKLLRSDSSCPLPNPKWSSI